ncbi:multiple antibiotic resistance regulatory protein MarB [Enterobacteriaceae bacterium 4M9]|nr:multiple antibiotic resistance regulatory protein MarB [Enterobacteriaceae bacterium 4M9]
MKRFMVSAALLTLLCATAQAATAPANPGDSTHDVTVIQPADNAPAWDFNHLGNGSDKSETLGSPYYNIR